MSNESQPQEWIYSSVTDSDDPNKKTFYVLHIGNNERFLLDSEIDAIQLCKSHNAALAAEREKQQKSLWEHIAKNENQQLLQAQAAIVKHNKHVERCNGVRTEYGDHLIVNVDLSALDKHDDEVRKPLVQAGSKLANLLKDSYWAQCPLDVAKSVDELLDALEKVNFTPSTTDALTTGRASVNAPKTNT